MGTTDGRAAERSKRFRLPAAVAAAVVLGTVSVAAACNVPVFRFALERWRPDPYRAVLLHRGVLTEADRKQIQPLQDRQDQGLANLSIETVDVSQLDGAAEEDSADAALFASLGDVALPALVVQYPPHLQIARPVWTGSPSAEAIGKLLDSPVRKELVRRLAEGQTAVWLVLESGQKEQDDAAAALVEAEIRKLEQELELPELTTAPEDEILSDTPLKVAFSTIRVPRDAADEQALVAMLIGSEPDLVERTEPMVFPVFGRGRALWGLIGVGITPKNIHDSASFLVGACSCEVKELNPGFDLLLSTDWDQQLSSGGVPLASIEPTAIPAEAELVPIPAGSTPPATAAPKTATYVAPVVVVQQSYLHATLVSPKTWIVAGAVVVGLLFVAVLVGLSHARGRDLGT